MSYVEMYEQMVQDYIQEQLYVCQDRLNKYEYSQLTESEVPKLQNYRHMPYPHNIPVNTAQWTCELSDYNFNNGILNFTVMSVNHQQPFSFEERGIALYMNSSGSLYMKHVTVRDTIPNLAKIRLTKKEGYVVAPGNSEFMWFTDDTSVFHCRQHRIEGHHKEMYRHDILSIIKYTFESEEYGIKAMFGVWD